MTVRFLLSLVLSLGAVQAPQGPTSYVPERVFDTGHHTFSDFEAMLADLAKADAVVVGEQHDDPNTHRLELAVLEGLIRRGALVTVSLEMFERDTQPTIDAYLAGKTTEEEFLKASRPWPRYATDYRALVEVAKTNGSPVVAANLPRKYASEVAKAGLSALENLPAAERAWIARDVQCPKDAYFMRFSESMADHSVPAADKLSPEQRQAATDRYYFSQCLKDETMAEAVATAVRVQDRKPVVHFNGAFHSDFGSGTVERLRRRLGDRRVAVISILPVKDLDAISPTADDLKRADYLVYTVR